MEDQVTFDEWALDVTCAARLAIRELDDACNKLRKAQQLITEIKDMKNPEETND